MTTDYLLPDYLDRPEIEEAAEEVASAARDFSLDLAGQIAYAIETESLTKAYDHLVLAILKITGAVP